jgi:hypothetical protein
MRDVKRPIAVPAFLRTMTLDRQESPGRGATAAEPADGAPPSVFRVGPDPETGDPVITLVAADIVFRHSEGRLYVALAADPDAPLSLDSFKTRDGYEAPWAAGIDGDAKTYPTLSGLIGGTLNVKHIRAHSDDILRLAVSIMRPLRPRLNMIRRLEDRGVADLCQIHLADERSETSAIASDHRVEQPA